LPEVSGLSFSDRYLAVSHAAESAEIHAGYDGTSI
jgi:hypothetical protein